MAKIFKALDQSENGTQQSIFPLKPFNCGNQTIKLIMQLNKLHGLEVISARVNNYTANQEVWSLAKNNKLLGKKM